MPFNNYDSRHFSETEKTAIINALEALETSLSGKLANLSPDEKQQYGSINEHNKLIVNQVRDYHTNKPALASPQIDWEEFENDFQSRFLLENVMKSMENLLDGVQSAKILHDADNYRAALVDYDYTKYMNNTGTVGYLKKVEDIKQFFPNISGGVKPIPDTPDEAS